MLIGLYGGYDVIGVPAGEATNPRRHLPFAFVGTIVIVTIVMTLTQISAQGTLPSLPSSTTPLADAALVFLGSGGALLIGVGSAISMTGGTAGQILTGARMLFALAQHRELPAILRYVHPRSRTPSNAILVTAAVSLALALTGTFRSMVLASAVTRLVTYSGVCAATLQLRRDRFAGRVKPATFVVSGGPVVPLLGLAVSGAILAGASRSELLTGLAALIAGAVLFLLNRQLAGAAAEVRHTPVDLTNRQSGT